MQQGEIDVFQIEAFDLEHLRRARRPRPQPGHGEVVVRVRAAALNYRDLLMVRGHYNPRQPLPLIPMSDGVGEVVAVGPGVTRVRMGDRVASLFAQEWSAGAPTREGLDSTLGGPRDGMLAQEVALPADGVIPVPAHLTDAEAATLPCAALTAWSALVTHGGVRAGDTVLVMGTGGVSIFALQFARVLGARVIATSSSDAKLERVRAMGAAETVNYRDNPEWGKLVRRLSGGGVDHVVEVGGAGTLQQSLKAVRPGGQISLIGVLSGIAADVNLMPVLMQQIRVQGVLVGHRESFAAMNRAIALHQLRPVVDRVVPFAEAPAAFEHLASGQHFGKVVIGVE